MKFTEAKLEQTFIELLEQEGYPYTHGNTIKRSPEEVLIEEDLRQFLATKYADVNITETEISTIILQLKSLPASDLYESNKSFMHLLSDGLILKREDRSQKDVYIQLIDYTGLGNQRYDEDSLHKIIADDETKYGQDQNSYRFVNQLEIIGDEKRIPDGILYINGLPLVVFEFKTDERIFTSPTEEVGSSSLSTSKSSIDFLPVMLFSLEISILNPSFILRLSNSFWFF